MKSSTRGVAALVVCALLAALASQLVGPSVTALPAAPTAPERFLDTRIGLGARPGKIGPGETVSVVVPSAAGASSIAINITATEADGPGWVKVWPCGEPEPATSILNFTPARTAQANAAILRVGVGSAICFSTYAAVHVVADLSAWFSGTDDFVGTTPNRLVDTRITGDPLQPNEDRHVTVAGTAGVPTGAGAVAMNITVDAAPTDGWVLAYPCGSPPTASTINFKAGETAATMTVVALSAGQVCLRSWGVVQVVVDIYGWSSGTAGLRVQSPQRLLDTRQPSWPHGPLAAGSTIALPVAGRGGIATDAQSALLTVTVADTGGTGYVTVWPCGEALPMTSTINTWADQLRSNLAVVRLAADGTACFHLYSANGTPIALVVDAVGWTTGSSALTPPVTTPLPPTGGATGSGACGLASEAFCSSFDGSGSGAVDAGRWSVGRAVGDNHGDPGDAELFPSVPVPACRAGVSTVTADHDVMMCDAASGRNGKLMTALAAQNYGLLSLSPRQPFDFAGRTGTIVYDVDAVTSGALGWWTSLFVTDQPVPVASSASQVLGYLPRNGVGLTFDATCGAAGQVGVGSIAVYVDSVETFVANPSPTCVSAVRGTQNRFRVQISQSSVSVAASDAGSSTLRTIFSAPVALSFTRGYVHFQAAERAPVKYSISPGYTVNMWSRLGFDGPVLATPTASVAQDALTPASSGVYIGYSLHRGDSQTLSLTGVPSGATSAVLAFTAQLLSGTGQSISYRLNGAASHTASAAVAAQRVCHSCPGPDGGFGVGYAVPIDVSELRPGTNTITFTSAGQTDSWPFVIANVQLLTVTS